jgi:hypothetical protein
MTELPWAPAPPDQHLLRVVCARVPPELGEWLAAALGRARDEDELGELFDQAGRRLPGHAIEPRPIEEAALTRDGGPPLAGMSVRDCGRAALVLRALDALPEDAHATLLDALERRADAAGRRLIAWLKEA